MARSYPLDTVEASPRLHKSCEALKSHMWTCLGGWLALVEVSIVDLSSQGTGLVGCSWLVGGSNLRGYLGPAASKNEQRWEVERPIIRGQNAPVRILP